MKDLALIFGAGGYIARRFMKKYKRKFTFHAVHSPKKVTNTSLNVDLSLNKSSDDYNVECFVNNDLRLHKDLKTRKYKLVVFAQGINPRKGAGHIGIQDMIEMLNVNIVAPTIIIKRLHEYKLLDSDACIIFLGSIAATKGSYDPSYAAAKAGLIGLMNSLASAYPSYRFNMLSLGLVDGSPVHASMSQNYSQTHKSRMRNDSLVNVDDVIDTIRHVYVTKSIATANISIDCGFKL